MLAHAQPPYWPPPLVQWPGEWPEDYLLLHIVHTTKASCEEHDGPGGVVTRNGRLTQFGQMWYRWMRMQWERHLDRVHASTAWWDRG